MIIQAVQNISQTIQVKSSNLLFNPIRLLGEVGTMSLKSSKTKTACLINQKVRPV